jgi:two-component system, cell cycle sensor histidine kinase and response regulator CckA
LLQPQVVDINKRLNELSNLLERLLGGNVSLTFALEATQANALVDPGHFEHAIVNLVVNARDAIANGGVIQIATSNSRQPLTVLPFESLASQCGPSLEISVTDNGTGMEESVRSRVFEPFFTTKEQGKGTGLGLAMVYGFVQQSSGEIAVESKLGFGSTFRILLPTVSDQPTCSNDATTKVAPQGTETVLLVEDEKSVRELTELTLRKHGYRVLIAADGVEGLAVASQFDGKIDLLISDLVMPHMNGWQLAESLLKTRPDLRLLFISGYLDRSAGPQPNSLPEFGYCQKPFTPQGLLAKIQEVMRSANVS